MTVLRTTIFGGIKLKPNTFIGGIAKLGGTGVNAPINTRALLASKLGISEIRIRVFKAIGDNIQCHITGTYTLLIFGDAVSINANKNITYYLDNDNLCLSVENYGFSYCSNFTEYLLNGTTYQGIDTFAFTKVVSGFLKSGYATINTFRSCSLLTNIDASNLGGNWVNTFRDTPLLTSFTGGVATKLTSTFINSAIPSYSSSTVLETTQYAFGLGCKVVDVTLSNCTKFSNDSFRHSNTTQGQYLKNVVATKVTQTGSTEFVNALNLELVDIRSCRTMGTDVFLNALKSGVAVVKVHVFMATSNGGLADANLTFAKTTRGATVEFYDDAGNYVSTL